MVNIEILREYIIAILNSQCINNTVAKFLNK